MSGIGALDSQSKGDNSQAIAYRTDRQLRWDVAKEQFIGDSDANKMLTRDYRRPYVVEKI